MYPARPVLRSIFYLVLAGVFGRVCTAQAYTTASRAAEISAFGGYSPTYTDFGRHTYNGYMAGVDLTLFPRHWPVAPSLEFRYTHATGNIASENSYLVGPKIEKDFGRFRPYVTALVGNGRIAYHPVTLPFDPSDGGFTFAYGAGIDVDVTRHVALKLDFLQQNWDLGENPFYQPDGSNYTLTPWSGTVGAVYHFGGGIASLRHQRELR